MLLEEAGKLFERILAARIVLHLTNDGPELADCQYGFWRGRSTIDAILKVKTITEQAVERGCVVLAVSLDIANAFNSLPLSCIEALAGAPPCDLDAQVLAEVYRRCTEARINNGGPADEEIQSWRRQAREELFVKWRARLAEPNAGLRTVTAISPILKEWVDRRHTGLSKSCRDMAVLGATCAT